MAVQTDKMLERSPDSAAMMSYWDLTDTIVDGIEAMRACGEKHLPKFAGEDADDFNARLKFTKLTNVYRDAVEGLSAKPFEDEVSLIEDETKPIPEVITQFIENVDGSGNNLTAFAAATFFNGINSALDWILIDYPEADSTVRTVAEQKALGSRPYWSHILARNILDVQSAVVNSNETLLLVKIFEPGLTDRVRIFERMDDASIRWSLYEKGDKWIDYQDGKTQFVLISEGTMTIDVIPLVPFITARRDGRSWRFFPTMRDAAELQVELYQQESALKFAKTLTAYPMLAGNGIKPMTDAEGKPVKLSVGPQRVLYAPPDPSGAIGSWAYVEPSAASLKFLADDVKETIQQLRELSRQPLTAQSANLTVVTSAFAAGKSRSAVKSWAFTLKNALENALVITNKWLGEQYDPVVYVFTEFDEFLEGKDLDALNTARGAKDISQLTYWEELKRRSVLSSEFDPEIEAQRLLDELPGDQPGPLELNNNVP